jgi:hypothetical protein
MCRVARFKTPAEVAKRDGGTHAALKTMGEYSRKGKKEVIRQTQPLILEGREVQGGEQGCEREMEREEEEELEKLWTPSCMETERRRKDSGHLAFSHTSYFSCAHWPWPPPQGHG